MREWNSRSKGKALSRKEDRWPHGHCNRTNFVPIRCALCIRLGSEGAQIWKGVIAQALKMQ